MPLVIHIHIAKDKRNDLIAVSFTTLFGFIKYKIEFPMINWIISLQEEPVLEVDAEIDKNDKPQQKQKKRNLFDPKEIGNYQNQIGSFLERHFKDLYYIGRKTSVKTLQWKTVLGTGDAAITGILIGVIWTIKGMLISILQNHITCEETDILVQPNFREQQFMTYVNSIIQIKTGHIIIAALKLGLSFIKKGGEGNGKSSN